MDAPASELLPQRARFAAVPPRPLRRHRALRGERGRIARRARHDRAILSTRCRRRLALDPARSGSRSSGDQVWNPNTDIYGALSLIYGTAITSGVALLFAAPLSIAIGLYLSELAPSGVRGVVGALIEMLAAVPSVIIGLWGILVLGPFVQNDLEPFLGSFLGWTPFFRGAHHTGGFAARDDRADDHDHPDQLGHLPRAVPDRAGRPQGGRLRPRPDALGDGARRCPAVHARRSRRCASCSGWAARSARRSPSRR